MPLAHAVLALLNGDAGYGYELRTSFEAAVGPQWGGLNIGHVYQILERLRKSGDIAVDQTIEHTKADLHIVDYVERNADAPLLDVVEGARGAGVGGGRSADAAAGDGGAGAGGHSAREAGAGSVGHHRAARRLRRA